MLWAVIGICASESAYICHAFGDTAHGCVWWGFYDWSIHTTSNSIRCPGKTANVFSEIDCTSQSYIKLNRSIITWGSFHCTLAASTLYLKVSLHTLSSQVDLVCVEIVKLKFHEQICWFVWGSYVHKKSVQWAHKNVEYEYVAILNKVWTKYNPQI